MTAQQLRNSILQMAVSGKLVPQDPNDEPASVLLERIRKEKEQLIKDGKIKKEKNPSYIFRSADNTPYEKIGDAEPLSIADEVPFDIPDSWEWCRLSSVVSVLNGDRGKNYPAKSTLSASGIPFISALNLDGKTVVEDDNLLCLSEAQYEKLGNGKLIKGDIVVCIRGSLGKHGRFPFEKGAIASSLVILRPFCGFTLLSDYIMMYLDTPLFFAEIKRHDNGTAQPNLAANSLEQFFVPIPPINEQRRILQILSSIDPFVSKYNETFSALDKLNDSFPELLKKSVLQMAVQGKLVPQDTNDEPAGILLKRIHAEKEHLIAEGRIKRDKNESVIYRRDNSHYEKLGNNEVCIDSEISFELPDSWAWARLGNLISLLSGQDFEPSEYNADGRGVPYITGASNIDGENVIINRWTENPRNVAHNNELLIVCKGAGVGKMAVLKEETVHIARQIMAISPIITNLQYLQIVLRHNLDRLRRSMQGVIPGISRSDILNILCPVPPLVEQERIVKQINAIQKTINYL